jgi:hypothetical protein
MSEAQSRERGLAILEIFSEAQSAHAERSEWLQQGSYLQTITHDRAKRRWREANKAKQAAYSRAHYERRKAARAAARGCA